ncbi:MAG TPA: hypothetical protein ENJ52_02550 [Aliiroseovarius sp.]|nr:hypothetical protein [Aliiroseovarius sp.]
MTLRILTNALFAGLIAGAIVVLMQFLLTQNLILEAEDYESGAKVHFAGLAEPGVMHDHGEGVAIDPATATDMAEAAAAEETESIVKRFSLAFAVDFVIYVAWALIMSALVSIAVAKGYKMTLQTGLLWGLAGFVAVHVAPGIGLAPELPGIPAPDLQARQLWWIGTIIAAAIAMGLFAFGRNPIAIAAGVALLVIPHVIGAPALDELAGLAPPSLAAEYVARSFAVAITGWSVLGLAMAWFWMRPQST